ncbi:EspA/EspE family type VII secretion system effector [[Mycobacterium] fortunisiensis]|uniref:EspA/EspE family type VII secretion system effector n=1 Tax=[Mycobacterium] fortunisiensis TaxID=2600579 RepID=UPI001C253595|nr:EspA/EspE family type VII secretion system effector [[Mycobacterium] fortunisiensis]
MSALDAFLSTWSQARMTFGQGVPDDGSGYDGSERLLQLRSNIESAAPDHRWQGTASDAYASANKEHAEVYGKLADLDKRLAAEVKNAADVVTVGRKNLDEVRSWVVSMASTVPNNQVGRLMMLSVANKGIGQIDQIIRNSTGEMAAIGERVVAVTGEYDSITGNMKFGPGSDSKRNNVQAANFKQHPADEDDMKKPSDEEPGKKSSKGKSFGKGSDTHIQTHGETEEQWGHPTDTHEIWPNNPGKTGTFDGDHGKWEWHGPGMQGEAYGSQHSDGVKGKADAGAWGLKGEGSWSREIFGNPFEITGHGGVGVHGNADGVLTDHGVSLGADGFAGGELGVGAKYDAGPVDVSLDGTAQLGIGADAHLDAGMEGGKFVLGGTFGFAFGPGAKVSPHIAIDPDLVTGGVKSATDWLDGLFD